MFRKSLGQPPERNFMGSRFSWDPDATSFLQTGPKVQSLRQKKQSPKKPKQKQTTPLVHTHTIKHTHIKKTPKRTGEKRCNFFWLVWNSKSGQIIFLQKDGVVHIFISAQEWPHPKAKEDQRLIAVLLLRALLLSPWRFVPITAPRATAFSNQNLQMEKANLTFCSLCATQGSLTAVNTISGEEIHKSEVKIAQDKVNFLFHTPSLFLFLPSLLT